MSSPATKLRARDKPCPIGWVHNSPLRRWLADRISPQQPPVLVMSLPRSGSSWVGSTLASAENALYLREPMTQSGIASGRATVAIRDIDPSRVPDDYRNWTHNAMSGVPDFHPGIVKFPIQWQLRRRAFSRVVIKEVNPLALHWIIDTYAPIVIFLVRHPIAVAASYEKLGWLDLDMHDTLIQPDRLREGLLSPWVSQIESETDFWVQQGLRQGAVLTVALDALKEYPRTQIVQYEDLCQNPESVFRTLFEASSLKWGTKTEELISQCTQKQVSENPYDLSRDSKGMVQSWEKAVDRQNQRAVMDAWNQFELPWYTQ